MSNIYDNNEFFQAYSNMERSKYGLPSAGEWHLLRPLFPNLQNSTVLDLGCGYGWHCKYAAEQGAASVLGIDESEKMIQEARQRNGDAVIEYKVCSINQYEYPKNFYNLVISNLVLHYVEDLDKVFQNVYKTLKQGGSFLFNIEHPIFTAGVNQSWIYDENETALYWPVDNYFYPGKRETIFLDQKVNKQHHTLTQILNGLLTIGFTIEVIQEVTPPNEMMNIPGMEDEMRRPMMLLVKATKK